MTKYDEGLERTAANHQPMTPISYLRRAARTFPDHPALIHGRQRHGYARLWADCCRLASALLGRGIGRGDTVSVLLSNTPPMIHAHFGVPMAGGAVLHSINTRSDPATVAFQLDHAESRVLIVDREFSALAAEALALARVRPLVIDFDDAEYPDDAPHPKGEPIGRLDYEQLLAEGDPDFPGALPGDEWDAISLNYTSGTTGNPKGVVYHHRGAALMALNNIIHAGMGRHPVYLWTLPMFHCNGWCFPWTVPVQAGTQVCLRWVRAGAIFDAIADHGVTHLCGAPIVMSTLLNAPADQKRSFPQQVMFNTAAAPPPETVLQAMAQAGFGVTHLYGLTETYGPAVVNEWNPGWNGLPPAEQAARKARQGVRYLSLDELAVMDPETMQPVAADGRTLGEVMFRGNVVMKGYLKNPDATAAAFAGGWFHSGDLAVMHPDGYIQLKDRSKDIIISGGENISSIEIEEQLYRHPAVALCAVVAMPSEKWGETPCAFVELRKGGEETEAGLIAHCRAGLAGYKCPSRVVFGPLPKTSTGKVQKFALRARAVELARETA
ncbi:fatty-acyl-CoA synthase [Paracoccus pantotrophus]|uniref:3-methylmercaptopropionyl-CoA ligase n=1 Tax=Paracoccus pantotrophus TaxID=82367 RepID=A0AAE6TTJ0_PARPN|nr:acyl-CoA synthetase [Paracoccus pantotrophus]QFG36327.1 acyl-CoA synthetase [Paracoccus pantotrophus]RKS43090.1 fatty-acyl-CoA synthase [Paracoccus pantotrophus]